MPGQGLRVVPVDARGTPIPARSAPAGLALAPERLREEDPLALRDELARSSASLALARIAPGRSLALQAVFPELPAEATHFVFEAAPARSRGPAG